MERTITGIPSLSVGHENLEEPGTLNRRDSPNQQSLIQDGRWVPNQDPLTLRHGGRADVAFADGHEQAVPWNFGQDPNNSLPGQ